MIPQLFNFNSHEIQVVKDANGNPWFIVKEVCDILKYKNSRKAIKDNCKAKGVTAGYIPHPQSPSKNIKVQLINESNLYRLVSRSTLPEAEEFEEWIFEEVLPSIRKTGTYTAKPKDRRSKLLAAGKSLEFVEKRIETVETRKTFTGTLKDHGVEGSGYQTCTRSIYAPLFGGDGSTAYIKEKLGIDKKASVRDSIGLTALVAVQLSELIAADRIKEQNAQGNVVCADVCATSSRSVASAIKASRKQLSA